MNINFNAIVRVKLTELGKRKLIEKSDDLYGDTPMDLADNNIWEAPLWEVMNMLGEYTCMGALEIIVDGNLEFIQM